MSVNAIRERFDINENVEQALPSQVQEESEKLRQALPPQVQERLEKQAMLESDALAARLDDAPILSIDKIIDDERQGPPTYIVRTAEEEVEVRIEYLPQERGICGPARFELRFV